MMCGRQRQDEVGRLRRRWSPLREEPADDRDVAEERDRVLAVLLLSARKSPARKFVSPSFSRMFERDRPGSDDRLLLAGRNLHETVQVGDLERELQRHFLVVVNARLDLDLDADVLVLERRDRHDVAADGRPGVEAW